MNSRNYILNKLQRAAGNNSISDLPDINDRDIFRDYPEPGSQLELFKKRFEELHGELYITDNFTIAAKQLKDILSVNKKIKCIAPAEGLVEKVLSGVDFPPPAIRVVGSKPIASDIFAGYDVGISAADFLVARTGSIVIDSSNQYGRLLTVLPPVHIVIAEKKQLVASLQEVFNSDLLKQNWSCATIISGPSRTSDIEKQLVLGAHGPKRLILVLIK